MVTKPEAQVTAARGAPLDFSHVDTRRARYALDELGFADLAPEASREVRALIIACSDFAEGVARDGHGPSEEVPERLRRFALSLLPRVALLAFGEYAPSAEIARGHQLANHVLSLERKQAETWQEGLIAAFESLRDWPQEGFPIGAKASINAVHFIVDITAEHVGFDWLPPVMRYHPGLSPQERKSNYAAHERAASALRKMRLAGWNERAGGKAKKVSAFTAARDFATALGLSFPERERDLRRSTKSGRRVSPRTDGP